MKLPLGTQDAHIAKLAIAVVMERHPRLTADGFMPETMPDYAERRAYLSGELDSFWFARYWLMPFTRTMAVSRNGGIRSRALKERPERKFGLGISDGAFIAAALHLGFPFREEGPDVFIGIRRTAKLLHALKYDFVCDSPFSIEYRENSLSCAVTPISANDRC